MKRTLLILATALVAVAAQAQLSCGIQAGFDRVYVKADQLPIDLYENFDTLTLSGFHVGPVINYQFKSVPFLGVGGAIFYQFADRNTKKEHNQYSDVKAHLYRHAIQIPLRANLSFNFGKNFGIFLFAGPQFDLGLFYGNDVVYTNALGQKFDYRNNSYTGKCSLKINGKDYSNLIDDDRELLSFDIQMGVGAGLRFDHIYLSANYDFGLLNRYCDRDIRKDKKFRQDQLQINLGYQF